MDFRESCISSFFVHAIAILLLAAVSQHHLRQPESLVVTLSADTFERALKGGQPDIREVREVTMPQPPVAAEKETTVAAENPEDADVIAEEKPAAVQRDEKAPESSQATEAVPPPGPGRGIAELARAHHVIAIHTHAFVKSTSQSIQKALSREIAGDPSGGLNEGTAQVTVFFDNKGGIGEVWGSSESEKLKSVIARLDWGTIPSPAAFRLRMNGLRMLIKIEKGEPALYFSAL
jgi:hypothetical protein